MKTNTATYECLRGHVTTVNAGERVSVAIRCPKCIEMAYYQPTDAELDAAAREELNRPRPQIIYSAEAQANMDAVTYPYGQ